MGNELLMNFVRRCFRQDLPPYDVGNDDDEAVGETHELTVVTTSTMASSPIEAQSSCDKKVGIETKLPLSLGVSTLKRILGNSFSRITPPAVPTALALAGQGLGSLSIECEFSPIYSTYIKLADCKAENNKCRCGTRAGLF